MHYWYIQCWGWTLPFHLAHCIRHVPFHYVVLSIDFAKELVHWYQATITSLKVKNHIVMFPVGIMVASWKLGNGGLGMHSIFIFKYAEEKKIGSSPLKFTEVNRIHVKPEVLK